ncbi:ankyrin repeat domain-containing protein [Streptomyces sp. SKN60]|uniref:ankyrin repeat domain-containing protein n=1 Tax=Streptomyces sp. SKN60 TaxID=2855506 RepID=UPI0022458061|nr:ankyrin repeat domain-containing protein [Streptomyces sp. SKN60]MCX2181408.1 ankyrin repeat domain-containing protein [Streptomyces sp. SKN60]
MTPPTPLLPGVLSPADANAWARIRRFAVPGRMIERATEARLAGDWRAACAAAAVDVPDDLDPDLGLDPERVAERYGPEVAARLADDLRHFAPDLLRWHFPRTLGGHTTLAVDRRIVLADYGAPGGSGPVLSVTNLPMLEGPQRLRLHLGPARRTDTLHGVTYAQEDWTAARRFWDARRTAELRLSASPVATGRLPFLHPDGTPLTPDELPDTDPGSGADPATRAEWIAVLRARGEHVAAYAAAGLDLDLTPPEPQDQGGRYGYRRAVDVADLVTHDAMDLTRLAPELLLLWHAGRGTRFRVPVHWRGLLRATLDVTDTDTDTDTDAPVVRVVGIERRQDDDLPVLPLYARQLLPDVALLRAGRIRPEHLHPLVSAALFPEAPPATGPAGPHVSAPPVRVRCGGAWHETAVRDGALAVPHTEQERQRERALRAFGGTISGCFATELAWTTGEGRLPRALQAQRREFFEYVQHGDTPAVTALLDAGWDPHARDGRGRGLLHLLYLLDHRELLPRLLAAGLDLEARDKTGATPLQLAVAQQGSAALVRDLLDAGARIDVVDEMELSLAQVIRRYQRADLMFLRHRVLKEHPGLGSDWFDEYMDERNTDDEPDWDDDEDEDEDTSV